MAQTITITVGRLLARNERLTTAKINAIVKSIVIQLNGVVGTTDMADGAVTPIKVSPGAYSYAAATLSASNYTATFAPTVTSYVDGLWLTFKVNAANPLNATFNAGAGAKPLYQHGARVRPEAGDIPANSIVEVRYNSSLIAGGCWEVMTCIGPRPARSPFQPASAFLGGEQGLVPAPAASATRRYLRDDGQWVDAVALAVAQAAPASTLTEIFKQQQFV